MKKIKIAIVDDHQLVSKAIEEMLTNQPQFSVVCNCGNGDEFLQQMEISTFRPDVVLMDINMPFRNGIETTKAATEKYPGIKILALSVDDSEHTIIKMIKAGAVGYLLKDMSPEILFKAIEEVHTSGTFDPDFLHQNLAKAKMEEDTIQAILADLKDKEIQLLKLCCTELTYKEIADRMLVSPKTVDGYRDSLFIKLGVKSRIGIAMFALKNQMV